MLNQGRSGNRNLFCRSGVLWDACFVVVVLHIACFMHVPQALQPNGRLNVASRSREHRPRQSQLADLQKEQAVDGGRMYIVLFACACDKRAVVTATHYMLHMFCLFCTRVACSQCMFQELNMDPSKDPKEFQKDAKAIKRALVRLYMHPHDARTLHSSFDV